MFSRDVKRLSFRCQTLKFSRPNVKLSFSALLKGKMFSINKKGRNYQKGVPLSNDLRNQVKELAQDYCFSEVGRRLRISKGSVSKIVKQYNLTGSTAPKKLNHVRTVPKCTFQDSILLETMVQARGSSSLKELRDDLAIHGDCGELSTSTISRNIRNKLPSGRNYSRKRLGKCASERFTPENIVYTQLYIDYLKDKDPSSVKFFDESGFQLPDAGHRNFGFSPVGEDCVEARRYLSTANLTLNFLVGYDGVKYGNIIEGASNSVQFLRFCILWWGFPNSWSNNAKTNSRSWRHCCGGQSSRASWRSGKSSEKLPKWFGNRGGIFKAEIFVEVQIPGTSVG